MVKKYYEKEEYPPTVAGLKKYDTGISKKDFEYTPEEEQEILDFMKRVGIYGKDKGA
jgi:hypothetical protein